MRFSQKACRTCGEEKIITDFYRSPGARDGYASECKECTKERGRVNRVRLGRKKHRSPLSGRSSEQHVIDKMRSEGIYAVSGSATEYSWGDVVAWGCVVIEVKTAYFNGYSYQFGFTPTQFKRGIQADFVLLVCNVPQDDTITYHLFPAQHPVFYRSGRLKRGFGYTPGAKPKPPGDIVLSLNDQLMQQYENAWHLIEARRLEIQQALIEEYKGKFQAHGDK